MALFRKRNTSSNVARERLKLVLIHDRAGTSPSSDILESMRKDILCVISKYFDIEEDLSDIEIMNTRDDRGSNATRLTATIPISRIKSLGKNKS
jgi:cell division topological specificity factor